MTIQELNSLDQSRFVAAIGWVFEHSPWVAERVWLRRPFENIESLHAAMVTEVQQARPEEQMALLQAHPDLGTRARMSSASTGEQSGAGLNALEPAEFERLQRLNTAYRDKFGFPFLFAVKGSTKHDVLRALEERLEASAEEEYAVALRQVYRIVDFRLREIVNNQ